MKTDKMIYDTPEMTVCWLAEGDVITWSTQSGAIGGNNTGYDSDDFENMFQ